MPPPLAEGAVPYADGTPTTVAQYATDVATFLQWSADPHMEVMTLRGHMLEKHARYVPVVESGTLLGVVSFHDVAKAVYEEQSFENTMLKDYIAAA